MDKRFLDISFFKNKIVQKAIYLVFLEVYDNKLNYFSKYSYGFRPNKSRHSALYDIKVSWQAINWYLSLDLQEVFSFLDKSLFIKSLQMNVCNKALFLLLGQMFKPITEKKNVV